MIRLLVKLAVAALIANATWRLGSAYASFYRFKDSVQQAVQFGGGKPEAELQQRVLELASQYDLPVDESSFSIRRENNHTYVTGSYIQPVEIVPGYRYGWTFAWDIDAFTVEPPRHDPSEVR